MKRKLLPLPRLAGQRHFFSWGTGVQYDKGWAQSKPLGWVGVSSCGGITNSPNMGEKCKVCPLVVGITNSPNMGETRTVFLPGGHMGPPLRRTVRLGGICPTCFVM